MAGRFTGKSVLVAGGTGALGRAVSLAFLDELARVAVTYQQEEEFVSLKNAAAAHASSLEGHKVNVIDDVAVRQLTDSIIMKSGRLDVLVNAVGAYAGGTPLWELDSKVFDQMLALNLRSGYVLLRVVVPVMLKQGNGAIVNVASRAAFDHAAGGAAYAASKAAAVAMIALLQPASRPRQTQWESAAGPREAMFEAGDHQPGYASGARWHLASRFAETANAFPRRPGAANCRAFQASTAEEPSAWTW